MNDQKKNNVILEIKDLKTYYSLPTKQLITSDPSEKETLYFKAPYTQHGQTVHLKSQRTNRSQEKTLWRDAMNGFYPEKIPSIIIKAVDGVSFSIYKNKCVSIVGESGCGKTSLIMAIFRLLSPNLSYYDGEINFYLTDNDVVNLSSLPYDELRSFFGRHMSLIMQNPKSSLDPSFQIGFQVGEALESLSWRQEKIKDKVIEYLGKVALPQGVAKKWSKQLSLGEAQRACIASALIADSMILFGDEPLKALDTITRGQIIQLLNDLKENLGLTYFFSTHNIAAAINIGDYIAIMYGGEIVESQPIQEFLTEPLHPYSKGLLRAVPWYADQQGIQLEEIPGTIPSASNWPTGCKFHPRCNMCRGECTNKKPPRVKIGDGFVECFHYV